MTKDMSVSQFRAALKRHGMRMSELGGFVGMGPFGKCSQAHVYAANAGPNRRAQLAYLLQERDKLVEKYGESAEAV
jgi:hypothetical protein